MEDLDETNKISPRKKVQQNAKIMNTGHNFESSST